MKSSSLFRNFLAVVALAIAATAVTSVLPTQKAEAATSVYDSFFSDVYAGNIVVASDTFKCGLVTSSYTFSKGTHAKRSDITSEVVGTGYTAGGATCTLTVSTDTTNHRIDITMTNVSWTTATLTARGFYIYKARGGASSADNLVAFGDFGANVSSTASTFTAQMTTPIRIDNN